MLVIDEVSAMQRHAEEARREGRRVVLVPTMGALHEGHLALIEHAGEEGDRVFVSIFVNPTQFAPGEDYEHYPRRLVEDVETLKAQGVAGAVFAPTVEEMYPAGAEEQRVWLTVEGLDEHLCGRYRPGHFRGVLTVVMKLFAACRPHAAVFGLKDAQQFVIIRRMVEDLRLGIDIIGVPTVREADGLARSSRNKYLSKEERGQAVVLSEAVEAARTRILEGELQVEALIEAMRQRLSQAPLAEVQYAEVVDARRLEPIEKLEPGQEVLCAVAVFFGETRLIDNAFVHVPADL